MNFEVYRAAESSRERQHGCDARVRRTDGHIGPRGLEDLSLPEYRFRSREAGIDHRETELIGNLTGDSYPLHGGYSCSHSHSLCQCNLPSCFGGRLWKRDKCCQESRR